MKETALQAAPRIDRALVTLRGLFLAQSDVELSADEIGRRSGLDETTCSALLWALENARFLSRSPTGRFILRRRPSRVGTREITHEPVEFIR
jgi:DNA-binding IclR family transcriptional regulator